jgi:glutamate--cysteine ligase
MRAQKMSITELVLQKSREYTHYFQNAALDAAVKRNFDLQVKTSLAQQKQLDATDEIPFDKYLSNYFSQDASASIIQSQDLPQNLPVSMVETAAR